MTVAKKLYLLVFSAIIGLASLSILGATQIQQVYSAANYANINTVPSLLALKKAASNIALLRIRIWQYVSESDSAKRKEIRQAMEDSSTKANAAFDLYEKNYLSDEKDRGLLNANRAALHTYNDLLQKVFTLTEAGNAEDARALLFASGAIPAKLNAALDAQDEYNVQLGDAGAKNADDTLQKTKINATVIAVILTLLITALGIMIVRSLLKQLGGEPAYVAKIAQQIAKGDLSSAFQLKQDDRSSILFAMKTMRDSLTQIISKIHAGSHVIATASTQIAAGNLDLAARTEEQAGSLEETVSAMEEITATIKQNADHANRASTMATMASETAVRGGTVVSEVIHTMGSINDSSNKIVDIINVIDGIAFQTNILALNAAVEAARAGEEGRGFAVVASEVRSLAQRSAAAAKEIKILIGESVEKVDAGSKLVSQAGATMQEIVSSFETVTTIVKEISSASLEQSSGAEQINRAMTQMDEVTQQNAALVEQASAASQSLQFQATALTELVSVFILDKSQTLQTTPPLYQRHAPDLLSDGVQPKTALPSTTATRKIAHTTSDEDGNWETF